MLRTFRIGGIHPPENKLSAGKKITALAAPKQVIIPLSQHIGAPAQAVVKKGDLVKVGTLVAKAGGFVSANIHSSVSGKVNKIDNALDSSGYKRPAIYIDVEGDEWEETIDRSDALVKDCTLSSKEIVDKIAAAGIVGLGGATFPTQVKLAAAYPGIEIMPLKVQYPQGGEKQLIDAITKRQVASGALPISTGAVVQNVGTAFAVYEAVQKNKPLFERVITVTGKSVAQPSNFLARIGTPMQQLIDACGGLPEDTGKIIGGGPMMGKALVNTDVPTAKGSSGILIMNRKEAKRGEVQNCIRCAKCVSACPMGLEPYLLSALAENTEFERMESERIMDCIECGSCQFTCPANRPLLDYCRLGKGKVGAMIRARQAKK